MSVSVHLKSLSSICPYQKQSYNQSQFSVLQHVHKEDSAEERRLWQVTTTVLWQRAVREDARAISLNYHGKNPRVNHILAILKVISLGK